MAYRQRPGMAKPRTKGAGLPPVEEPTEPVPERYKGVNFPYRGINKHGVEVPEDAQYNTREFQFDMPEQEDLPEYVEPDDEPEPVAVRVVQDAARERLEFRTIRANVTNQRTQLVNRLDTRRNLVVKVDNGVSAIYIGDETVTTYTGFKLDQTEEIHIRSTEPLYAVCAGDDTSEVSVLYEHGVEL